MQTTPSTSPVTRFALRLDTDLHAAYTRVAHARWDSLNATINRVLREQLAAEQASVAKATDTQEVAA